MQEKIQVIDADYVIEGETPVVRIFGKTTGGENFLGLVDDFTPYFYAVPADIDRAEEQLQEEEFEDDGDPLPVTGIDRVVKFDGNDEVEVLKVYTTVPPNVPKLKDEAWDLDSVEECREFDIPFYRRFLIDTGIRPGEWISVEGEGVERENFDTALQLKDIETGVDLEEEPGFEKLAFDLEVYDDQVIMASLYSKDYRKLLTIEDIDRDYVEEVENEETLIKRLIEIVENRDVDVLEGYNTDDFDFDVLRDRAEEHNFELSLGRNGERMKFNRRGRFSGARLKGRMHLDLYPFVAHVMAPGLESETLDLDSVAEELLGRNKDDMSWDEMKESWEKKQELEKFADYALKDAELTYYLGEELVPQILELSRIAGLIPFDACRLTYGQLTENYLIREAYERNMLV
ncbi:MAG: 3'-5' exonuclease, partial [Candidatus Nanohaloarchaea archaeon]